MKNFIQSGVNLTIPTASAVTSGNPVIAGSIIGIAAGDANAGGTVDVVTAGVFELPKVAANAFTVGAPVYWNGTLATSTATGNTQIGVAIAGAGASTGAVRVRLSAF